MRSKVLNSALLVATVLGTGCSIVYGDELDTKQCKVDADCEAAATSLDTPLECRENACQAPTCSDTSECPSGSMCSDRLCVGEDHGSSDAGADSGPLVVTCTQDTDCGEGELCGYDSVCYSKWGCLDEEPDWPSAPASFDYHQKIQDINGPDPALVGPVTVSACTFSDPSCMRPIVVNKDVAISADKVMTVPLTGQTSSGFRGAIRVESTVPGTDILPGYVHFTTETPLVGSFMAPHALTLIPKSRFDNLKLFTGIAASPDAAGGYVYIYDCGGRPAADVSLVIHDAPPGTTVIPIQGEAGLVVGSNKTTTDGTLIIANLPPNLVRVFTLTDEESGRVLTDTFNIIPRGPAVNFVSYYPRYRTVLQLAAHAERLGGGPQ